MASNAWSNAYRILILHRFISFAGCFFIYCRGSVPHMQPQDAQMMGQVAPAGAMGQQVIIVQNKSGGPKVFGIIAIILGGLGLLNGVLGVGDWDGGLWIFTGLMGIVSAGLFAWAGVLLMQYQRKGVWVGFGSVGINLVSGLVFTMVVAKEANDELGEDAGGFFASLGIAIVGIQAVCCSAIVALPLLMNGADLE